MPPPRAGGPPFEVRRLGWGIFSIDAEIILKEPYGWITEQADLQRRVENLKLSWMLNFSGRCQHIRIRARVKKMEENVPNEENRPETVFWPNLDRDNV